MYGSHKRICASGVPTNPFFAYCDGLFVKGTEAQKRIAGRIAEVDVSVFSFGTFLRTAHAGLVKWSSISQ